HEGTANLEQFLLALLEGCLLVVLNGGRQAQCRGLLGKLGGRLGKLVLLLLHLAQLPLQADPRLVALLFRKLGGEIFQNGDAQGDRRHRERDGRGDDLAVVTEESFQERPIDRADGTHSSPTTLSDPRHYVSRFLFFELGLFRTSILASILWRSCQV